MNIIEQGYEDMIHQITASLATENPHAYEIF
jgi:hypothetical protein